MPGDAIAFDGASADLARQLREARLRLNLSQERLAEALGVSFTTVNRWETGRSRPTAGHRRALARLAALPPADATPRPPGADADADRPGPLLPLPLTSFIGRVDELAKVAALLGRTPLVTLTGPGGTGKTRLALEAARRVAGEYDGGVTLVELAALSDPAGVPALLSACYRLPPQPGRSPAEALAAMLAGRRALLLLDNCEHLLDASAALVATLLLACPGLTVLATSREALRVPGETVLRVPPLALPVDTTALPGEAMPSPAPAGRSESERLFLERARARRPEIDPDQAALTAIAAICRRLDGLPLAIELAAAHAGSLAIADIAARLDDRFRLLARGSRTAPPRHQTLRAAIDWSYALLDPVERRVFAELSIFAGGFDLAAAEAVCADTGTVAVVERLVDASLLVFSESAGQARYHYLETLRAYAAERLAEQTDAAEVRNRHAVYFCDLARRLAADPLKGPDWVERAQRDIDNLRATLAWLETCGERSTLAEVAAALATYWRLRGLFREGRAWCARALADEAALAPVPRMWALHTAGLLAREEGDGPAAIASMARAAALARAHGATAALLTMLPMLAYAYHDLADWETMAAICQEALDLCGVPSDAAGIQRRAAIVHNLGIARFYLGANAEARALFLDELAMAQRIGNMHPEALALTLLGAVARTEGQDGEARRLFAMALDRWARLGFTGAVAIAQAWLSDLRRRSGDLRAALALANEAIITHQRIGARLEVARDLVFVVLLAAPVAPEQGAALVAVIDALAGAVPALTPPALEGEYRQAVTAIRRTLGAAAFAQRYQAARPAPPEETIARALEALARLIGARDGGMPGGNGAPGSGVGAAPSLSGRERTVLGLIASGASNKEIAAALALSPRTVERHIANLYAKLGARGRADAIAWAHAHTIHPFPN